MTTAGKNIIFYFKKPMATHFFARRQRQSPCITQRYEMYVIRKSNRATEIEGIDRGRAYEEALWKSKAEDHE